MKNESIIVCIPGKWQSIKEVAIGLATYPDYQLKGNMIFFRLDSNVYELHYEIRDETLREALEYAGSSKLLQENIELSKIITQ